MYVLMLAGFLLHLSLVGCSFLPYSSVGCVSVYLVAKILHKRENVEII